jgi:hypothetical protein
MKRLLGVAALSLAVIVLTLLASGCSKSSDEKSDAQGDTVKLVDGEVILIKSATPNRDASLDVVADRIDYNQSAMDFFVSGESSSELHSIVSDNVGKKIIVRIDENQIVAAEEIEGTRYFESPSESTATEVVANPPLEFPYRAVVICSSPSNWNIHICLGDPNRGTSLDLHNGDSFQQYTAREFLQQRGPGKFVPNVGYEILLRNNFDVSIASAINGWDVTLQIFDQRTGAKLYEDTGSRGELLQISN